MPAVDDKIRVYRELAEIYDGQGQAQMRDRFLVLAADTALQAGRAEEAERLRTHLLRLNPHHLLKPYDSFAEAAKSTDVENYLTALRRSHPYERTEHLLESMRQAEAQGIRGPGDGAGRGSMPDLQVFRVADVGGSPKSDLARTRSVAPEYSTPRDKPSRPVPAKTPPRPTPPNATATTGYSLRSDARSSGGHAGFELVEDGPVAGAWFSTALGLLALLGGIVLAVYTFARPFVPRHWLP